MQVAGEDALIKRVRQIYSFGSISPADQIPYPWLGPKIFHKLIAK
jgi:hypothetical protein